MIVDQARARAFTKVRALVSCIEIVLAIEIILMLLLEETLFSLDHIREKAEPQLKSAVPQT
ncbi:MAG: hypothetical protein C0507_15805 [Cyanobacteria bacterium PR.3.49]|jgi:hypothetical protein|nr:hypothetical protein [Cyanobacteria bacterium PR.3.49]